MRIYKKLYKLALFAISSLTFLFCSQQAYAQIAILNSNTSAAAYSKIHLGDYNVFWNEIIQTFSRTNIKYKIVTENQIKNVKNYDYNVLILPQILDLPPEVLANIENFQRNGGKLIVIFPESYSTLTTNRLAELVGIRLDSPRNATYSTYVTWLGNVKTSENEFPSSTKMATIRLTTNAQPLAVWETIEENAPAITISNSGSYIGWRWGNDGSMAFNNFAIKEIIKALNPGLLEKEQTKIDSKEFANMMNEIAKFRRDAQEFLDTLIQSDTNSPLAEIQEHIWISKVQENLSKSHYENGDYDKAKETAEKSRVNAMSAYAKSVPSNIVEGRTLWLDRGTIVSIQTPQEMAELFDKIQKIGINMVYMETLNAGYTIYPSTITEQNPLTKGWDPLACAVKEAHKRNIELHAWTWIFAVGNTRHNPIIGKRYDYPGPILSKNYELALLGPEGNLIPVNQHEYWLDPANPRARELVLSILEEIVKNYQVDGIQLDYIRYPFQKRTNLMGFDVVGRQKFEIETGCNLDRLDNYTIQLWNKWKTKQISKFVQDASTSLRKIKPDIKISAAVFGGNRQNRISSIQQDWEDWVDKGWVDILNPMIYSLNTNQLADNLNYLIKAVDNKALIYPGIAVRVIEEADLLEQIYKIKELGLSGNTLFAMAHLGPEKSEILSVGPYRLKGAKVPNKNTLISVKAIIDEFFTKANKLKLNNKNASVVYNYSADMVIAEAQNLQTYIAGIVNNPSIDNIEKAKLMLQNLKKLTETWLLTEKQTKLTRIKLLTNYLKEANALLSYEQHKLLVKEIIPVRSISSKTQP